MEALIYTDGSCNAKTKLGGVGAVVRIFDDEGELVNRYDLSDSYGNTKTGRMEIIAVMTALSSLFDAVDDVKAISCVRIFSDSQYVVNSISKGWINKWRRQGWCCANSDLRISYLDLSSNFRSISMNWVKGHNGDEFNEIADKLAVSGYNRAKCGDFCVDEEEIS